MGRVLPLFALLGSIGFSAFALAGEPTPPASTADPSTAPRPDGVVGDVDATKAKQAEAAANRAQKSKPLSKDGAKDKEKAAQSGNDATLRQLPSPAQRGSE
jgi:hypothetical protein